MNETPWPLFEFAEEETLAPEAPADNPPVSLPASIYEANAPAARVRVMHFADVHLGVETYGRYNPETGLNTRLEDFTQSLNHAIDLALQNDVDLAIFAGDAYKARDPNQTHQRAFAAALKRLVENDVPVVMLVGNHDIPNARGRAHALEIYDILNPAAGRGGASVTIFQKPEMLPITTRRGLVLVAGVPYLTRSRVLAQEENRQRSVEEVAELIRDKYIHYITELAKEVSEFPGVIALLTGHFTIANARVGAGTQQELLNANEPQVPLDAITRTDAFDYVAMGHVHKYQDMNHGHQPPVVYCGSIDRIDFGERAEPKGFVIADVQKRFTTVRPVPVPARPFLQIEVDATEGDDPTQTILNAIYKQETARAVVRVQYRVSPEKASLVRHDEIRKALGAAHMTVAISREAANANTLTRSAGFSEENLTPERALELYIAGQPRLQYRKDELLHAARPLFERLNTE